MGSGSANCPPPHQEPLYDDDAVRRRKRLAVVRAGHAPVGSASKALERTR